MTTPEGRTALYRLYSESDRLLYVGITNDPDQRFAQHKATKRWWPRVTRKSVEWYSTREAAAAAEIAAIRAGEPWFNREHSPGAVITLELSNRAQAQGLDLLCKMFGASRASVLGTLLIRELSARGLLGDGPCFHNACGWPEGLIIAPKHYDGEQCSCGALVSDPHDIWRQWRLQLEAKDPAAPGTENTSDGVATSSR